MPRFIFAYRAGKPAETPDGAEEIRADWQDWLGSISDSVVGDGGRCGPSHTVSADGVKPNGGPNPLAGFTQVEAPDIDAAIDLAKGCPAIANGGSVEVTEVLAM